MAETDRHEPQIYQLRVVLRGISPLIWRRLLVRRDNTVAQLHEVLQIAFGWDDEHLNRFESRGREYSVYHDGGGIIGIDATKVRLCDLNLRRLERFVYEYDFGDSWIHHLRLETTLPVNPRNTYPLCVAGKCSAPPEDCGGPGGFMANRRYFAGFDRRQSDEDLEDCMDALDDEELGCLIAKETILKELERAKWFLWHVNVFRADETLTDLMFEVDGAIEEDREPRRPAHLVPKKLARAPEEFTTYIDNNASGIVNYGERHQCGERRYEWTLALPSFRAILACTKADPPLQCTFHSVVDFWLVAG